MAAAVNSRLVAELSASGYDEAAQKLVELVGDNDRLHSWDSLYCSRAMFRAEWLGELVGEGTYTMVREHLGDPRVVVGVPKMGFDADTDSDSMDAAYLDHHFMTLDAAVRFGQAGEINNVSVPHAFTTAVDKGKIYFLFFMARHTPFRESRMSRRAWRDDDLLLKMAVTLCRSGMAGERAGLAHRDPKPDNVVVTSDDRVLLCDWGGAAPHGTTGYPFECLNPPWMSPEELGAAIRGVEYEWAENSTAFAIGLAIINAGQGKPMWSEHRPKKGGWRASIANAHEWYSREYDRLLEWGKDGTRGGPIMLVALQLAHPREAERITLDEACCRLEQLAEEWNSFIPGSSPSPSPVPVSSSPTASSPLLGDRRDAGGGFGSMMRRKGAVPGGPTVLAAEEHSGGGGDSI